MMNKHDIYKRIKTLGFNPQIIADVGCHNGSWSSNIKSIYPQSYIIGVDANKLNDGNISGVNLALFEVLSDADGKELSFFKTTTGSGTGDSVYIENSQHYQEHNTAIELRITRTLKSILNEHNITKLDLLKIDTQGSELDILKGLGDFICDIEFIELECSFAEYNIGGKQFDDVYQFLRNDFKIYDITDFFRSYSSDLIQSDVIFQNKKSKIVKVF